MLRQPVASATRWLLAGGGKDSSAAFQELADHFTYIGKPHLRGALSISADGTTLSYTTPCKDGLVVIFFEDANSLPAILIREAGEWYSI